jgi:hypothetical protein
MDCCTSDVIIQNPERPCLGARRNMWLSEQSLQDFIGQSPPETHYLIASYSGRHCCLQAGSAASSSQSFRAVHLDVYLSACFFRASRFMDHAVHLDAYLSACRFKPEGLFVYLSARSGHDDRIAAGSPPESLAA